MTCVETTKVLPLNPTLYALLDRTFGSVRIHNVGQQARTVLTRSRENPHHMVSVPHSSGEYYAVCCPFCKDTGHKLWVNYRYGDGFLSNGRRSGTHLAHCYKDCLRDEPGRRAQLELLIFGSSRYTAPTGSVVSTSNDDDYSLPEIKPPGDIIPFDSLPENHPAAEYLKSRNFEPASLSTRYGVGFCKTASPLFPLMRGRIYIPILTNGTLVGWQGRAVGDTHRGPKYYNLPGIKKSRILYNLDTASKQDFAVIVEGIPSVWRVGDRAVCLFGKSLSHWQRMTIATAFNSKPVFIVLDNDAQDQTESMYAALTSVGMKQVVPVFLPDQRDPADYEKEELISILRATASAVGVTGDFKI